MTVKIIKISKKRSRYGGFFYLVCFKSLEGKSLISYIYKSMRNYKRWCKVLDVGTSLSGLKLLKGRRNIIDADSKFVVVEE